LTVIAAISAVHASRQIRVYRMEPPQTAAYDVAPRAGNFASAPAIRPGALIYEAIGDVHYVLRMPGRDLVFEGEAFHPSLARQGPVYFELVAGGHSRICAYDLIGGKLETVIGPELDPMEPAISPDGSRLAFVSGGALFVQQGEVLPSRVVSDPTFFPDSAQIAFADGPPGRRSIRTVSLTTHAVRTLVEGGDVFDPAISPDGRYLAYTAAETGARQVWVQDLASGFRRKLTQGACNNDTPAWEPASRSVVFSSDCGRGMGLPALYRLPL
jgi:Tol biopolymer transport system component